MPAIKSPAEVARSTGTVNNQATVAQLTEQSSITLVGYFVSTGAAFSRSFPTVIAAEQWLTTGGAADVEITRMIPITKFVA